MALVVFLRGVNVGGHRTFRPSVLAQQLERFDAVSIGAAGTFVIRKPPSQAELLAELKRRLPFETEIVICRGRDLIATASEDPFAGEPIQKDVVRFVSILAKRPRVLPSLPLSISDLPSAAHAIGCQSLGNPSGVALRVAMSTSTHFGGSAGASGNKV